MYDFLAYEGFTYLSSYLFLYLWPMTQTVERLDISLLFLNP